MGREIVTESGSLHDPTSQLDTVWDFQTGHWSRGIPEEDSNTIVNTWRTIVNTQVGADFGNWPGVPAAMWDFVVVKVMDNCMRGSVRR